MKIIILMCIVMSLLIVGVSAEENKVYSVTLDYDNGKISLVDVSLKQGLGPDLINQEQEYVAKIMSYDNKELYSYQFRISTEINVPLTIDDEDDVPPIIISEVEYILLLPYFSEGKVINIYDLEDKKLLEIDVSKFTDYCGDGKCSNNENEETCKEDCSEGKKIRLMWKIIISSVVLIILVIIFFILFKRKKSDEIMINN